VGCEWELGGRTRWQTSQGGSTRGAEEAGRRIKAIPVYQEEGLEAEELIAGVEGWDQIRTAADIRADSVFFPFVWRNNSKKQRI
jgi:hypothetical protein